MKQRGSVAVARALADEGVRFTFGIPGTHNIELYDALDRSATVEPILVTDERCAAFMADAVSRTSEQVGVVNLVPGAGVTHALSGVAEAYLDTVPLVILVCGIRGDTGKAYQLHAIDQLALLAPVTKRCFRAERAADLYPLIRAAFREARRGSPGPVAVEIPADLLMLAHELSPLNAAAVGKENADPAAAAPPEAIDRAARLLEQARRPVLYVGVGARRAAARLVQVAERLGAPVATTIQGKGVFPESHPLWLWNGLGAQAPPFVRRITDSSDLVLAIGCRFSEVATGSYGIEPRRLIHVDINADVFNRNVRAELCIEADAGAFLSALSERLVEKRRWRDLAGEIATGHGEVQDGWRRRSSEAVGATALFRALQRHCRADAIYSTDSGNGTFLAMEHLRLDAPGRFIAPVDFSCMGYAIPAAIGAAFANPGRDVVALAGDGALLMTGQELISAAAYRVPLLACVLRDGKLGQIAQFQKIPLNRETCSILPPFDVSALARAAGCAHMPIARESELDEVLSRALRTVRDGAPVVVEIALDDDETTYFTKGVLKTNFWRLPWGDRLRMLARAVARRI